MSCKIFCIDTIMRYRILSFQSQYKLLYKCRSEGLATLFAETDEAPEEVTRDLGEPVTEAPGYGVKQKGEQMYYEGVLRVFLTDFIDTQTRMFSFFWFFLTLCNFNLS